MGADPLSSCTTTTGVIVIVDFTAFHNGNPWDGTVQRGCAASAVSGDQAMVAAGFTPAGDVHDGPAFVCRINGDPSDSQDPCVDTPPANASWSYWHGDVHTDTWTYSASGFMSYCPPPGSVEAWVFSGSPDAGPGGRPSQPPSAFAATAPGPPAADPCDGSSGGSTPLGGGTTSGSSGAPAGSGTPNPAAASGPVNPAGPAPSTSTTTTTAPARGSGGAASDPGSGPTGSASSHPAGHAPAASGSATDPRVVDVSPASIVRPRSAGSPWPLVGGLAVALVVVVVGTLTAVRSRRRPGEG
ncbi:MAG: hypothetical protein JO368_03080 [Acidimicrobiales bacterium]|nr:hypothetical protein [Acidimicrobiales bacterium]